MSLVFEIIFLLYTAAFKIITPSSGNFRLQTTAIKKIAIIIKYESGKMFQVCIKSNNIKCHTHQNNWMHVYIHMYYRIHTSNAYVPLLNEYTYSRFYKAVHIHVRTRDQTNVPFAREIDWCKFYLKSILFSSRVLKHDNMHARGLDLRVASFLAE